VIVLFGGEKGGTGKSTLAINLAVWLVRHGRDVLLVDTDQQRTASHWVDRRNALNGLGTVHCAERRGNVFHALRDLAKRYDEVIVDAGGRDSEELRTAMVGAHHLYMPLKASQPDLETSLHMDELVKLARGMNQDLQDHAIISMAPTNPAINEAQEAMELLAGSHRVTGNRQARRKAALGHRGDLET
jgi:chromosome partitioning protein